MYQDMRHTIHTDVHPRIRRAVVNLTRPAQSIKAGPRRFQCIRAGNGIIFILC